MATVRTRAGGTWLDELGLDEWRTGRVFGGAELPVLYAHGVHSQPDSVVLAASDYRRAYAGKLAPVLERLGGYAPRTVEVDGLTYREGLNAVAIAGGVAGNIIPDECVVTVNYRFAPDRDEAAAEAHVRSVFGGFDVEIVDSAPGARPGLDAALAKRFAALVPGPATAAHGPSLPLTLLPAPLAALREAVQPDEPRGRHRRGRHSAIMGADFNVGQPP